APLEGHVGAEIGGSQEEGHRKWPGHSRREARSPGHRKRLKKRPRLEKPEPTTSAAVSSQVGNCRWLTCRHGIPHPATSHVRPGGGRGPGRGPGEKPPPRRASVKASVSWGSPRSA